MDDSNKVKLAGWKNAPKLADLKADFEGAQSDQTTHESNVKRWLSNLAADQQVKAKKGRSKVVPKLIRKQAEWRYPALSEPFLGTDDLFNATPKTFEDKGAAEQNEMLLNYQFSRQIDKVKFIDEYVRAATDEGTVVVKVGWDFEEEPQMVEVPVMEIDPMTGQPVQVGVTAEEQMVTVKNQPTIEVCGYDCVMIDPTCDGCIPKAGFVIHSFETDLSEMRKDGRYTNLGKIDTSLGADRVPDYTGAETSFTFQDDARKKFVIHEYHGYWDYEGDGIARPIICTWAGNVMVRLEESPFPFRRVPFVLVQYLPVRKSNFGEPDGELLEDNQKIVGAVTRGMMDIMGRSANGQMGTRKDALDTVNSRKFERGEDYKFNANVDPKQAFQMGIYPEVPRSALEMITLQSNEAESLTGVKAFNQGINGNALGDSVGGIKSAMDATAKREMGILRRFGNGIVEIGYMMLKMNQEWLSDEEIIRVTNEPVKIVRDDLAGDYDIQLNVSTPEADAEKARGLEFMLQTTGNNFPFEFTQIILSDIAKLKKQPELAQQIKEFEQQPDPAQQEKAMLEIELLKAQIRNENAKAIENETDIGLKQAKTETEKAKARNLNSGSDQKDLKFVEDESGTTQERELQKQDNDSKNKNEQKLVDSMVAGESESN